ncbi:MAG: hypothetical protein RL208_206 [Pseudomonadota bacterium]|jgi:tRNA-dihydrouridine synthase B
MKNIGFKIGNFDIKYPAIPAPMCGIMDAPFRSILAKFGTPMLYTEMIASHATTIENKQEYIKSAAKKVSDNIPFVIQIAGCNPEIMSHAAKMCVELGADIIDMNFGCPVKKVTNGYAGSALMKDEVLSEKIIEAVVKSVNIPVTIKMRTGWSDENRNAPSLAKIAEKHGIKTVTVHGRTRSQMYNGKADWSFIQEVKNSINIPVIVNGDIQTIEDLQNAISQSNANGGMIARGIYGKPWLIKEMMHFMEHGKKKCFKPQNLWQGCIQEHIELIFDFYGIQHGIGFATKHLFFYSKDTNGGAKFRSEIGGLKDKDTIISKSRDFFNLQ